MHVSTIFQRTESGRSEIKNKMHGLTQSERLALIVVDGVSPYSELRQKLKGLADERFQRALNKLLQKNLIFEVLLPTGAEEHGYDASTVDRFLHQDPLDPVTVISFDAEDEFGLDVGAGENGASQHSALQPPTGVPNESSRSVQSQSGAKSVMQREASVTAQTRLLTVDIYLPLEKMSNKAISSAHAGRSPFQSRDFGASSDHGGDPFGRPNARGQRWQWGQLALLAGVVLLVASVLFKLTH